MAKRFTDTELYDREAFLVLPPRLKVAWEILNKRCNHFGVWQISMTKLSFEVGETVTLDELKQHFKVQVFSDDQLYIEGFVAFQYGDDEGRLSPNNRFHRSVAEKLRAYGLPEPMWKTTDAPIDTDSDGQREGVDTLSDGCREGQGQGQGKGKGKEERGCGGKQNSALIETVDDLKKHIPLLLREKWAKEYPDPGWLETQISRAFDFHNADPAQRPKTPGQWIRKLTSWLGTAWDSRKASPRDFNGKGKVDAPDWELLAAIALQSILKRGSGSKAVKEIETDLGPDLYKLVCKTGMQKIRDVKADSFQMRNIAAMLKRTFELNKSGGTNGELREVSGLRDSFG